ncbi:MAG: HAD family hydrolase [Methylococcaceae bacterium]|nr:HAD family hydrolase [Methylococcaceae bacterium]
MNRRSIYALDFDGVICDSAIETGISGWKAATQIWPDMPAEMPDHTLLDQFRCVRPLLETGYEAILIIRLLYLGESVMAIMDDYAQKMHASLADTKLDVKSLKQLFGTTRDQWIEADIDDWLQMNPLFPGIAEKLQHLDKQGPWYIVTTKQERFVKKILATHHLNLSDERIFGLERTMNKADMLINIMTKHPDDQLILVEDRLPTLIDVANNAKLAAVKLFLATWGYNTDSEKQALGAGPIKLLALEDFLVCR